MLKNITISAEEKLIQKAREKARKEQTTLNENIRKWLKQYVDSGSTSKNFDELMNSFSYASPGKSFSKEEMNER